METTGWHRLKVESLDKNRSISLVAEDDPEAKSLQKKSLLTLQKSGFVKHLTDKCEAKDKFFGCCPLNQGLLWEGSKAT